MSAAQITATLARLTHVDLATETNASEWDAFVESHRESRFCQLWGYRRALERAYKLHCVYLKLWLDGEPAGVFPATVSHRGGRHLLSQPFNEYGGLLSNVPESYHPALADAIFTWARDHGFSVVRIRGGLGSEAIAASTYCDRRELQSYGELHLRPADVLWKHALTHRARSAVKRAQESGLICEIRRGSSAISGEFYPLYLASMKRLGVPQHSRRFFEELNQGLGDRLISAWVSYEAHLLAVLLGGISGSRIHTIVIASDPRYWGMHPNDLANWELLKWAAGYGLAWFDFGSASSADQLRFKSKWGADIRPYFHYVLRASENSASELAQPTPTSDTYKRIWRNVLPLPLERVIGPLLRRYLC